MATQSIPRARHRESTGYKRVRVMLGKTLGYLALVVIATVVLIPFLWTLSSSFKTLGEIFVYPPQWIPDPWVWTNYPEGLAAMKFGLRLRNTLFIAMAATVGALLSNSMAAYGFARFHFTGRATLFTVLLSTLMIPSQVTMIPAFLLFQRLHWLNTYLPLIVPAFFGNAFFIFLLRQFLVNLPPDLEDAAKIDGCTPLGTWWRIILPLCKPALVTVAIFSFMGQWNEFLGPLIYLSDDRLYPLSIGIAVFKSSYQTQWHLLLACSVVISIPPLVLFFLAQRLIIQGVVLSGIKG